MSEQARIFITRAIPEEAIALLRESCDVHVWPDEMPPSPEELRKALRNCEGAITMLTDRIDASLLDASPQLRVISNYAVGYDNIDIPAATQRGIPIGHTPGVLTEACADHAFALLLAAARRLSEGERLIRADSWKTWHPLMLLGQDVHRATLGIIGFGRIGQAVARRAKGFDMRILTTSSSQDKVAEKMGVEVCDLETLLKESDFISLHAPLTPKTKHLIDEKALNLMKASAILINTARGAVVDQDALITALREKRIAAAALDVTTPEPIGADHPLMQLDNCLVVPHLASGTHHTRIQMGLLAARNLLAGLNGQRLPHCVNPQVFR